MTDGRVNFGTSNWQWGYFHNTAGASFNTDAASLVSAAQAVFDADWQSDYAVPLHSGRDYTHPKTPNAQSKEVLNAH